MKNKIDRILTFIKSLRHKNGKEKSISTFEDISRNEIDIIAQLIEAEGGNQDMIGMRLIADVIYNRIDSDSFPHIQNIMDVISDESSDSFPSVKNGEFNKAAYMISGDALLASTMECEKNRRFNTQVLYFSDSKESCKGNSTFLHRGDLWFSW